MFVKIFVARFLKLHARAHRALIRALALQMHQMRLRLIHNFAARLNDAVAEIGFFKKEEKTLIEKKAVCAQAQSFELFDIHRHARPDYAVNQRRRCAVVIEQAPRYAAVGELGGQRRLRHHRRLQRAVGAAQFGAGQRGIKALQRLNQQGRHIVLKFDIGVQNQGIAPLCRIQAGIHRRGKA